MYFNYFRFFIAFFLIALTFKAFCEEAVASTWKSTYYNALPNRNDITPQYCQQHEPGAFMGRVEDQLRNGALTSNNIKLSNFTFNQHVKDGVYFMYGTVMASGTSNTRPWQDQIKYFVYKLTENGDTYGVWTTPECKGFYKGVIVK